MFFGTLIDLKDNKDSDDFKEVTAGTGKARNAAILMVDICGRCHRPDNFRRGR